MQSFLDKNKKKWTIEINVGNARKVKAECNIDLINAIDFSAGSEKNVLQELHDDPCALVDVIWCLCREQAQKENVDEYTFATLFNADAIVAATDALVEEIINFSPPAKKAALIKVYQIARNFVGKQNETLNKIMEDPAFTQEIESQMNKLYMDSLESSE